MQSSRTLLIALVVVLVAGLAVTGYALYQEKRQPDGVGHYGVFSGRKWDGQIYPIVRNMIVANS